MEWLWLLVVCLPGLAVILGGALWTGTNDDDVPR